MAKTKLPLKIVTAKELGDPLVAQAVNFRFVAFLNRLSQELRVPFATVAEKADAILRLCGIEKEIEL